MSHPAHNLSYFWHYKKTIMLAALGIAVLAILVSFVQPLRYAATSQFLIIERGAFSADPYTSIRSSERIGDHLSRIIHTADFLQKVRESGFSISHSTFPQDERRMRKMWGKMVETEVARGTGLLTVRVYHKDKNQAVEISRAISAVLTTRSPEYVGGDIGVKLVDPPLASRFPVRPNVLGNAISGFVLGILFGIAYVLYRGHERYRARGGELHSV